MSYAIYDTQIGPVCIREEDGAVTQLFRIEVGQEPVGPQEPTELLNRAAQQVREYLSGKRKTFDLALAPKGTPFQQQVWKALQSIPYGETRSYRQIAEEIGNPKAMRAVGHANHRNPILLLIPCHRVIGSNKSLTGFAAGLEVKQKLLDLEAGAETQPADRKEGQVALC